MDWPSKISLAQLPTPLHRLNRISNEIGKNIWLKRDDLSGFILSGNKVRKLEYLLAKAKAEGADTVITCGGLQSNHCRATAFACATAGLKCHLVLRDGVRNQSGNLFLDLLAGAQISILSPVDYKQNLLGELNAIAAKYAQAGRRAFIIPTGGSDAEGIWGYIQAAFELKRDFEFAGIEPSHIVCASGSGGTQAGLIVGCDLAELNCSVLGFAVCDDQAYFANKIASDIADWRQLYSCKGLSSSINICVNDQHVGDGYACSRNEELAFIAGVARKEGVLLDPVYSGKAFFGLISELRKNPDAYGDDIVFVHTGGGFGAFPYEQQWLSVLDRL